MLGGRHLPTYLEAVNFENDLDKHHRKLGQIQNGQIKRKPLFDNDAAKLVQSRSQNMKFHNSEKHLAIERDNELLLGRLVEISRKKQNPIFANEPANNHKSLNANYRKKEKSRIAAENEAFARRLLSQQPSFNRQKLDNDFEKHAERVRLMQKWMPFTPKVKLPPIQYARYEDPDRKSQSGKEKRSVKDINKKKRRKSQKAEKVTEEEREEMAEAEERREQEEAAEVQARLKEQQEQKAREEQERKEREQKEQKAKEEQEQRERQQREKQEAEQKLAQEQAAQLKKEEGQTAQVKANPEGQQTDKK